MSVGWRPEVTSGHLETRGQAPVRGAGHELKPGVVGVSGDARPRPRVHHPRREILVRGVGGAPRGQGAVEAAVGSGPGMVKELRGMRGLVTQTAVPQLCVLQQESVNRSKALYRIYNFLFEVETLESLFNCQLKCYNLLAYSTFYVLP